MVEGLIGEMGRSRILINKYQWKKRQHSDATFSIDLSAGETHRMGSSHLCTDKHLPFLSLTSSSAKLIFIPSLSAHLNLQILYSESREKSKAVSRSLARVGRSVGRYLFLFHEAGHVAGTGRLEARKRAVRSRTRLMVNISVHVVNGLARFLPTRRFLLDVGRSITRTEQLE